MPKKKPNKENKETNPSSERTFVIEKFIAHFPEGTEISVSGYGKWVLYKTPDGDFAQFTRIKIQLWDIVNNKAELQGLTNNDIKFLEKTLKDTLNSDYSLCEYLPLSE